MSVARYMDQLSANSGRNKDIPNGGLRHTHSLSLPRSHRRLFQGTVSIDQENQHRPEGIETTDRLRACKTSRLIPHITGLLAERVCVCVCMCVWAVLYS